ncbi:15175_t:CDS:2, partial [Dentiscutata erythropus]
MIYYVKLLDLKTRQTITVLNLYSEVICVTAKELQFVYFPVLAISTHGPCSAETFNAILAIDVLKETAL